MPEEITQPIPGVRAFSESSRSAELSAAAQLLILGIELREDDLVHKGYAERHGGDFIPIEDRAALQLPVPTVRAGGKRFSRSEVRRSNDEIRILPQVPQNARRPSIARTAQSFYTDPTPFTAAQLFEAALHHPAEIIRVAAAVSYPRITADYADLIGILEAGTFSSDRLVLKVAANALGHLAPDHPRLSELRRHRRTGGPASPAHTAILVHGTWASDQPWWQPGGDFFTYCHENVRPDLYGGADRYEWSGGYSDAARSVAAVELVSWLQKHSALDATIISHSHGGSVAMLSTHEAVSTEELVLLSCPVHIPKYLPDFSHVGKVVSIRVRLDLVIMADRGGQRFPSPIEENVLPVWFDHSATHDPAIWEKYKVPSML
ncbi:MAG: hypothetical protein NW701_14060 [Nitrospira sp.]